MGHILAGTPLFGLFNDSVFIGPDKVKNDTPLLNFFK
jgi:hypothetical protein